MDSRLAVAESYRAHLSYWDIEAIEHVDTVYGRLTPTELKDYDRWMERVGALGSEEEAIGFYDWMSRSKWRAGALHSRKWTKLFTSGVWAWAIIEEMAPDGPVLDVGCNSGYWTSWLQESTGRATLGIDNCERAIRLGQRIIADNALQGHIQVGDCREPTKEGPFAAIVSLQGIGDVANEEFGPVLGTLANQLLPDGVLISIDMQIYRAGADLDESLRAHELSVSRIGVAGGLGIDGVEPDPVFGTWSPVPAVALQRGKQATVSMGEVEGRSLDIWNEHFSLWANDQMAADWSRRNTAYFWADGREIARMV